MGIENLLMRFELATRAEGKSLRTVDHVKLALKLFTSYIGDIQDVSTVTADDLRQFILALEQRPKWAGTPHQKEEKISRTAINTYVRGVKRFWAWLAQEGIIKENPLVKIRTPKVPKLLPKIISEKDMVAVVDAVANNPRETALILLLLDSGITLSEVAELDDSYVDTAAGTVRVFREKTQKERYAYFSAPTGAAIEAYRFVRPEPVGAPRLFLTEDGRPLVEKRIQKILERVGRRANLKQRLSPHKLRHSFATYSLKYGSNLEYIRIMLGHSDIRTTSKTYLHMANTDIAEASKITSPVVNLGIRRVNGKSSKTGVSQNGNATSIKIPRKKGAGKTISIIQKQFQRELADGANLPVKTPDSFEKQDDMPRVIEKLSAFNANLGGTELNAVLVIQEFWAKFELGMSRTDIVEALTKLFPSENPGIEYFDIADSLLGELSLLQIIRSEQRRMSNIRTQWDTTFWVLTDNGRKVVQYLKDGG